MKHIAIIVFKDYGIATVTEGISYSEYQRTCDALRKHPEFVALYETDDITLLRPGTDQAADSPKLI